jgi:hypothetical protein
VILGGCEVPRDASFGTRAAATTGTFVGASAFLLAMPVLIPTAILYSLVTRTPLISEAPVTPPAPPAEPQGTVEVPLGAR